MWDPNYLISCAVVENLKYLMNCIILMMTLMTSAVSLSVFEIFAISCSA